MCMCTVCVVCMHLVPKCMVSVYRHVCECVMCVHVCCVRVCVLCYGYVYNACLPCSETQ